MEWVLLAYRIPREPSTPRIAVWRKLRKLGAVQLVDGFVALPADPATIEAFDWLADEVIEAGGEAWTWQARPGSKQQQAALKERLTAAATEEYAAFVAEADDLGDAPPRRSIERLRRDLRAIESRDRFDAAGRTAARAALKRAEARLADDDREVAR